jgi:hypothetical protein
MTKSKYKQCMNLAEDKSQAHSEDDSAVVELMPLIENIVLKLLKIRIV